MTVDETQSEVRDLERENRELREQLKELRHLEEDLMAQRAFEKAKRYLFSWLTFGGILLTIVALFGVNSVYNYMVSQIDDKLSSMTQEQLGEVIRDASENYVRTHFTDQKEDINVLVNKHIRQVVVSLQKSPEAVSLTSTSTEVAATTDSSSSREAPEGESPTDAVAAVDSPSEPDADRQPEQPVPVVASPEIPAEDWANRFYDLPDLAKEAARSGEFDTAQELASELLFLANEFETDWNYGNAIHDANIVLGLVALSRDDIGAAEAHLLAAGNTEGSPQLDSFGPNMMLAEALLQRDETKAVLEYFKLCRAFWELHDGQLDLWSQQVLAGLIPDFGANLRY